MKYLEPSFSTFAVGSDSYRENHDRIFGKKSETTVTAIEGDTGTTETITDPADATLAGALCTCNLEPSFMVAPDEDNEHRFDVVDAECELVATCREERYARLIAKMLENACNANWVVCLVHPEGT